MKKKLKSYNQLFIGSTVGLLMCLSVVGAQDFFIGPELLGRPTDSSITISVLNTAKMEIFIEYGTQSGVYEYKTGTVATAANVPNITVVSNLEPDKPYYYRVNYRTGEDWISREEHSFHTQRSSGSNFVFNVISDSHFDSDMNNSDLYTVTLNTINSEVQKPDFLIDCGDAFLVENNPTVMETRMLYIAQRVPLGIFSHSIPIFMALGNHDNVERWNIDDVSIVANSTPVISTNARKLYYLNPFPDRFYSGNTDRSIAAINGNGYLEDYYAWKWGDALFVVLDPYWYSSKKPFWGALGGEANDETVGNLWDWTLGREQYDWLKSTLEKSPETYKFIFIHHLTAGTGNWIWAPYGRGGAKAAQYSEWGGLNMAGIDVFAQNRPGWEKPIHDMLVDYNVSAVFHGHDHFFAKEELDGIVYQEVPQPADDQYSNGFATNGEDYNGAVTYPNSGYLRVNVTQNAAEVAYIRTYLPGDGINGETAFSYNIKGKSNGNVPPVAYDQQITVHENVPVSIHLNASDENGDPCTFTINKMCAHGTMNGSGADWIYTPFNGYTGQDTIAYTVFDGSERSNEARVYLSVISAANNGAMEWGTLTVGGNNQTVTLQNEYDDPVIVCSVQYTNNSTPVVTRVGNVTSKSFSVYLQNPSNGSVQHEVVSYLVVEKGSWEINGVKIEAQKYISTQTDNAESWVGESQQYLNSYTNPVVVGQVMSSNDTRWSVFWCMGNVRTNPPSSSTLVTGKNVCEDSDTDRLNETVGFIVFEAGHGIIGGVAFEAAIGGDLIQGVGDTPPQTYTFNTLFAQTPQVAITSIMGANGNNGGWAQAHGAQPLTKSSIDLSVDEDQIRDSERQHTAEKVGYIVFLSDGNSRN